MPDVPGKDPVAPSREELLAAELLIEDVRDAHVAEIYDRPVFVCRAVYRHATEADRDAFLSAEREALRVW